MGTLRMSSLRRSAVTVTISRVGSSAANAAEEMHAAQSANNCRLFMGLAQEKGNGEIADGDWHGKRLALPCSREGTGGTPMTIITVRSWDAVAHGRMCLESIT